MQSLSFSKCVERDGRGWAMGFDCHPPPKPTKLDFNRAIQNDIPPLGDVIIDGKKFVGEKYKNKIDPPTCERQILDVVVKKEFLRLC